SIDRHPHLGVFCSTNSFDSLLLAYTPIGMEFPVHVNVHHLLDQLKDRSPCPQRKANNSLKLLGIVWLNPHVGKSPEDTGGSRRWGRLTFELSRVRRPQAVARRLERGVRHCCGGATSLTPCQTAGQPHGRVAATALALSRLYLINAPSTVSRPRA